MKYPFTLAALLTAYSLSSTSSLACEAHYDATRSALSLSCVQVNQDTIQAELLLDIERLPEASFILTELNPIIEPPVRWQDTNLGKVLADKDGMTLYMFDNDTPSKSNCLGNCSMRWPALSSDSAGMSHDGFSVMTRDDGSLQWAYHGQPLYYWFQDEKVGDTLGNGVNNVWHVIHNTKVDTQYVSTNLGEVMAAANGMTLYMFDNDQVNKSNCNDDCTTRWPPLFASEHSHSYGDYSVITRDDDSLQWAYKGKPLYFWFQDVNVGDTLGDGVGGVWHVIHNDVPPVDFNVTALGTVMVAQQNSMTLYTFDRDQPSKSNCNDDCATRWPPLLANEHARSQGAFSVISRDDGSLQWAYQGQPLHFWFEDQKPGDTLGDGVGGVWHVLYR